MVKEYILKKSIDAAVTVASRILQKSDSRLSTSKDDVEITLAQHLKRVKNWSSEISFNDLRKAKRTTDIYIDLDLLLYPRKRKIENVEQIGTVPIKRIFEGESRHVVLLGGPGAGKTTSMKYFCQKLLYDESFYADRFNFPILIRLRDLNQKTSEFLRERPLIGRLWQILGLQIDFPERLSGDNDSEARSTIIERVVIETLEETSPLIILDGFDEIVYKKRRKAVIQEIRSLANQLEKAAFIVTSRTGDFSYRIDNTAPYEICPLDEGQILKFASRWLADDRQAKKLLKAIHESPFADTVIRPLTIAHLCAIYERIGKIPDKPKTVYKKIVNLLLEEWDEQRSVKRVSQYANFEIDRKFEFLCNLAYVLTTSVQQTVFSKADLMRVYDRIHHDYDLKGSEIRQVANELESHTGLLIQSGYDQFEFSHKSLQEYLAAEYIVKLPSIPDNSRVIARLPNEFAIAVTISSSPSSYFSELVFKRLTESRLPLDFVKNFITRLLLEKPDFNVSRQVGFALLALYSLYMDLHLNREAQLKLFVIDELIAQFEGFVKIVFKRNSRLEIMDHYEVADCKTAIDGEKILLLKRLPVENEQLDATTFRLLPQNLYSRREFLEDVRG